MKKLFALLVALVGSIGLLSSCGHKTETPTPTPTPETPEVTPTPTQPAVSEDLKKAQEFVKSIYQASEGNVTVNMDRAAKVPVNGKEFTVSWAVTVKSGNAEAVSVVKAEDNSKYVVNITYNNTITEEVKFTLTATITSAENESVTLDFEYTIPKFQANTVNQMLTEKDETGKVYFLEGIVTAINNVNGKDSFVLSDATGSIFCYEKKLDIRLGQKIQITGNYGVNSGYPQISNVSLVQVMSENNDVVAASGTPVVTTVEEINTKAKAADSNEALAPEYIGKYLEVTGYVVLSGGYANFAIAADQPSCCNLYANADINLKQYAGTKVVLRGFARGVSKGNGITIQVQSATLAEGEKLPTPEDHDEPAVTAKTLAELIAIAKADEMKAAYTTSFIVKGLGQYGDAETAGDYGNFIATDGNGNDILVYGATATASALTWDRASGTYGFKNPKDFMTNELTKNIVVGDTVKALVVRTSYGDKLELYAIITEVVQAELTDADKVAAAKEALTIDTADKVVNFTLPIVGTNETTISWSSNNAAIAIDGANATVTQPAVGAEDVVVTLTATIKSGEVTDTKTFEVKVKAQAADPNVAKVAAAKAALTLGDISAVTANLTLPAVGEHESVITWATADATVITAAGVVARPDFATGDKIVKLTATITLGEVTDTKEFDVTVSYDPTATVEEFITLKNTSRKAELTGYITAVNKIGEKGAFVLTDKEGNSVFCYSGLNVKLGDEVKVSGTYTHNNQLHQINNPALVGEVISEGNNVATLSGTPNTIEIADVLALLEKTDVTNEEIVAAYSGKYLVIKGYVVEVTTTNGTFKYLASTQGGAGVISLYCNKDIDLTDYVGEEITVYGFMRGNSIKSKYLTVQVQSVTQKVLTDAEKVAAAKEALTIEGDLTAVVDDLNLVQTGLHGATIAWASSNTAVMANDGVITRPAAGQADATITLTATITVGETTDTKEFTVVVKAEPQDLDQLAVEAALADFSYANKTVTVDFDLPATVDGHEGVVVTWEVTEGTAIVITEGKAVVTRPEFSLGNATVKLVATLTKNGKTVKADPVTITVTKADAVEPEIVEGKTVSDLLTIPTADEKKYAYKITATVSHLGQYDSQETAGIYGNIHITDGTKTILVYGATATRSALTFNTSTGLYAYTNQKDFESNAVTKDIKIRDVVELLVIKTNYQGSAQLNAVVLSVTPYEFTDEEKAEMDIDEITIPTRVTDGFELPTSGSKYQTVISWASSNETVISTTGVVTRPAAGQEDAKVTLTATFTQGEYTTTATYEVTVVATPAEGDDDEVKEVVELYKTGFESSESFTATTSYNNSSEKTFGPNDKKWATICGTATKTKPIAGSQSLQMRYYNNVSATPAGYMKFDVYNVTKLSFTYKTTNSMKLTVYYSTDSGATWVAYNTYDGKTSNTNVTIEFDEALISARFKFEATIISNQTNKSELHIDNIVISGYES